MSSKDLVIIEMEKQIKILMSLHIEAQATGLYYVILILIFHINTFM